MYHLVEITGPREKTIDKSRSFSKLHKQVRTKYAAKPQRDPVFRIYDGRPGGDMFVEYRASDDDMTRREGSETSPR